MKVIQKGLPISTDQSIGFLLGKCEICGHAVTGFLNEDAKLFQIENIEHIKGSYIGRCIHCNSMVLYYDMEVWICRNPKVSVFKGFYISYINELIKNAIAENEEKAKKNTGFVPTQYPTEKGKPVILNEVPIQKSKFDFSKFFSFFKLRKEK
jgi:hypothetical protein